MRAHLANVARRDEGLSEPPLSSKTISLTPDILQARPSGSSTSPKFSSSWVQQPTTPAPPTLISLSRQPRRPSGPSKMRFYGALTEPPQPCIERSGGVYSTAAPIARANSSTIPISPSRTLLHRQAAKSAWPEQENILLKTECPRHLMQEQVDVGQLTERMRELTQKATRFPCLRWTGLLRRNHQSPVARLCVELFW